MPLHLVTSPISPDLHKCAIDINEGVASGEIQGLGVVVVLKGRRFFVDAFGSLTRSPFESLGLVGELEQCLRDIGRRRLDTNTTR